MTTLKHLARHARPLSPTLDGAGPGLQLLSTGSSVAAAPPRSAPRCSAAALTTPTMLALHSTAEIICGRRFCHDCHVGFNVNFQQHASVQT
eukprot:6202915-Pleurochrysis_carterae.AAC.1